MFTEKINHWLSLSANIGVMAGLILVAMQINQNTEITKAQIANDYFLADMTLELAMMGDDPAKSWIKAVYAPEDIDQLDAAVIDRSSPRMRRSFSRASRNRGSALSIRPWRW